MIQRLINTILNLFGYAYLWIEQYKEYPEDNEILGIPVDKEFQHSSRRSLCRYMDVTLPQKGFYDLHSTSKIRLGCQLLKSFHSLKKADKKGVLSHMELKRLCKEFPNDMELGGIIRGVYWDVSN
tara:strand:- start:114 stop:488 length:375 start_codon:yes stop_codon:yes gene_type:complete